MELTILTLTKVMEICALCVLDRITSISSCWTQAFQALGLPSPSHTQTRSPHHHNCNFSSLEFFYFLICSLVSSPGFVRFRPGGPAFDLASQQH